VHVIEGVVPSDPLQEDQGNALVLPDRDMLERFGNPILQLMLERLEPDVSLNVRNQLGAIVIQGLLEGYPERAEPPGEGAAVGPRLHDEEGEVNSSDEEMEETMSTPKIFNRRLNAWVDRPLQCAGGCTNTRISRRTKTRVCNVCNQGLKTCTSCGSYFSENLRGPRCRSCRRHGLF